MNLNKLNYYNMSSQAIDQEYFKLQENIAACAMKNFKCSYRDPNSERYGDVELSHLFMYRRSVAIEWLKEVNYDNRTMLMEMFVAINNKIKAHLYL